MTLSLLSNINIASLAARLGASKEVAETIYTPAGYNTWVQELANPASELNALKEGIVFLLLDGTELLGDEGMESQDAGKSTLLPYLDLIESYTKAHPEFFFFVSTLDIPQRKHQPLLSVRTERAICTFWRQELETRNIPVLDLEELAANLGRERFYNPRMWLLGNIPFSQAGEALLLKEIQRILNAVRGIRKKCLILDLDNTLWGGIIGENGVGGIALAPTKNGSEYRQFQKRIKELKNQGILLAVVSKNNEEDALIPFRQHPDMILKEEDFALFYANWDPKPINIEKIAEQLNIGLGSFVFIDDNPVEQEAVRIALPEVTVPVFPKDSSQLESFIHDIARDYFLTLHLTDEDLKKTEQYQTEKKREGLKAQFGSMEEYLRSLEMVLTINPLTLADIPRAAQLTQKTNQFNLTTRRLTETQMLQQVESPTWHLWIGSLSDKFGAHGQIILALAEISGTTARVDTFLMSCRVMGRGVEKTFLQTIEEQLSLMKITEIIGEYIPSEKNGMVADFWSNNGYHSLQPEVKTSIQRYIKKAPFIKERSDIKVLSNEKKGQDKLKG
ncbi:MAG: HAD family hydrolase [Synergistaceae bacterium]|nr:HAD family hydrolase [Synergistaceae bacterium]MBP9956837.1 HAD family hydrolase [Synergistaceae bacterium]